MLATLAIANYRSLLRLAIPLGDLNVIAGPNGSCKSNLYRALRLLGETAQGGVVNALAAEGGWSRPSGRGLRTSPDACAAARLPCREGQGRSG